MDSTIEKIAIEIEKLKAVLDCLQGLGHDLPALDRNLTRIMASVKMLELNFIDPGKIGR
jgi:hypothetical protein